MEIPVVREITPEFLTAVAGIVISLVFSYLPRLNTWFAGLEEGAKKGLMAGILVVVTGTLFLLGCANLVVIQSFACDKPTLVHFAWALIWAVVANQSSYKLSPQTRAVKAAKAARDKIE